MLRWEKEREVCVCVWGGGGGGLRGKEREVEWVKGGETVSRHYCARFLT